MPSQFYEMYEIYIRNTDEKLLKRERKVRHEILNVYRRLLRIL